MCNIADVKLRAMIIVKFMGLGQCVRLTAENSMSP